MKTLGRILMIMVVFSMVAGLIVTLVNASGMNAHALDDTGQFRPQGRVNGAGLGQPNPGNRPPERGGQDGGSSAVRLVLGMLQNVVVIGVLVTMIVWPKNIAKKRKRASPVVTSDPKS